jgi:hypothetical protein
VNKYQLSILIFATGFLLNLIWETAQRPLYKGFISYIDSFWGCFVASIVDAVTVLLLYVFFAWWFKSLNWIKHLNWKIAALLILTGGAIAVGFEQWAFALDQWNYTERMPVVPIINIGLSPLLQLMLLPLMSYLISYKLLEKKGVDL